MQMAAIYTRVSSDRQREAHTIASQTAALVEWATTLDLEVPQQWIFEDDGYSWATLERPGLEQVRDLAAIGRRHRQGFPCCVHPPLPRVLSPLPRRRRSVLASLASRPLAALHQPMRRQNSFDRAWRLSAGGPAISARSSAISAVVKSRP